jgi:hypothetical protein
LVVVGKVDFVTLLVVVGNKRIQHLSSTAGNLPFGHNLTSSVS